MLQISGSQLYYLYRPFADMRKSFDSLAGLVVTGMSKSPTCGEVFIFINRRRNQIKLLFWEGDGFSIYYKRLEKGTYEIPVPGPGTSSLYITSSELRWMLEGVSLRSIKLRPRYRLPQKMEKQI
jgi:transposase